MKLKSKICNNCFAVMIWNAEKERWECRLCGNAEETNPKKDSLSYLG